MFDLLDTPGNDLDFGPSNEVSSDLSSNNCEFLLMFQRLIQVLRVVSKHVSFHLAVQWVSQRLLNS